MKSQTLPSPAAHNALAASLPGRLVQRFNHLAASLPNTLLALVARFSIAAVFWKSGQTKIEGFAVDIVSQEYTLGWPRLSDSAVSLFRDEYQLPLIPPELGAVMAAVGEHVLPALILLGIATRLSALGLLGMTMTIQLFVYPDAYPTHGTWAAVLLYLMVHGPGKLSVDHWIARWAARPAASAR